MLKQQEVIKSIQNVLQTNVSVCTSLGQPFVTQMNFIFNDMLQVGGWRCLGWYSVSVTSSSHMGPDLESTSPLHPDMLLACLLAAAKQPLRSGQCNSTACWGLLVDGRSSDLLARCLTCVSLSLLACRCTSCTAR